MPSDDAEEGDAWVDIAVAMFSLALMQSNDIGVLYVLGNVSLFPAEAEEFMQGLKQCWFPALESCRRNAFDPRGLPTS